MPAQPPRAAPGPARRRPGGAGRSCGDGAGRGALERHAGMAHLFRARRHVEDEGAVAGLDVARQLLGYGVVAPDKKGADRLVVLEWKEPVRVLLPLSRLAQLAELAVPRRIRDLHRELVSELAHAVFRVPGAGYRPRLGLIGARDDADADASGIHLRQRSVRAAAAPASDDPDTSKPDINPAGSGGVSFKLLTR